MAKPDNNELLKTHESFLVIEVDYSTKYVLKYSQGLKLLDALNGVELFTDPYSSTKTISPLPADKKIVAYVLSQEKYLEYKMNGILGVDTATDGKS
jgi:hypothetical protein